MNVRKIRSGRPSALARFVDYVHDAINPRGAAERRFWREHGHRFTSMAGASMSRALSDWNPGAGDANALTIDDLPKVRARARDAALNDPIAQAVRRTMADHVVGRGIVPQCVVDYEKLGISKEQAEEWQGRCEEHFREASKRADVTGRQDWVGTERLLYLSTWDGGDVFPSFPVTQDESGVIAPRINLIEAERVDIPPGSFSDPFIKGGVQIDKWGRAVGFHVYRGHPGDAQITRDKLRFEYWPTFKAGRRNIMQVYRQDRIGQARGVPGFAQALPLLDQVSQYVDETILASRIQNMLSVWISTAGDPSKTAQAMAGTVSPQERYRGLLETGMTAGSVNILGRGDEAKFLGPTTPGQYTDPFLTRLLRIIASCIGAPYEIVFGDVGAANYSSIRAAFQSFKKTIATEQDMMLPALEAYWRHTIYDAWLDGLLGPDALKVRFEDAPDEWARVNWVRPAPGYIDPTKEADAFVTMIDNKLMTRSQVIAEGGGSWGDVFEQLATEKEKLEELGLSADPVANQGGMPAAGENGEDPDSEAEEPADEPTEEKVTK